MSTPTALQYGTLFIGGGWPYPRGNERIEVRSPSTEEYVGSVPDGTEADIDAAVSAARRAFDDPTGWSAWEPDARADALDRLAAEIESCSDEFARRVALQNGMPITVAQTVEATFPSMVYRYYSALIRQTPFSERRDGLLGGTVQVDRKAVGVVGAIVPWNFPQTLTAFKLAPALAAGCTIVLKPSPETVLDAYLLAECIQECGFPDGVVNIVPAGREVSAYLVSHPDIDKVAFTGSTSAGRKIAETCARLLRPVTLELGGKSAAIVLDDADLAGSVEALFGATLLNNGQTCFLGTRILAPTRRYNEVVDTLSGLVSTMKVGDALDASTTIGPMVSAQHRARVEGYIAKGHEEGARLAAGGGRPDIDRGWFVEPTVFAGATNDHTIAREEIFGPVLVVLPYHSVDEAISLANASEYGLGGSVWTTDLEHGLAVAKRVQTGTIGINGYTPDPVAPFGGVKSSGLGRELGPEGLTAYQELQSIYLGDK